MDLLGPGCLGGHLSLHRHVRGAVSVEQCLQQRFRWLRALVSLMMPWRGERRNTGGATASRALGRRHWTLWPHRRRLVKAKQRIAHPLWKTKSQRVGHPEMSQLVKDAPPARYQ